MHLYLLTTLLAVPAYLTFRLLIHFATAFQRRRVAKKLGCAPLPQLPSDPLGISRMVELVKANKQDQTLEVLHGYFENLSQTNGRPVNTFGSHFLGVQGIMTRDPKNIQAILATQFKKFELGPVRFGTLGPLLGRGIFSADGHQWEHSRALLRPQFSRNQISDLDLEETHVQNLIKVLRANESDGWSETIDLCPIFFRLTMDSATQFLFGESVDTQLASLRTNDPAWKRHAAFAQSFDGSQDCMSKAFMLGDFYSWGLTKEYKEHIKVVHEYIDYFVQKALSPGEKTKSDHYVFLEQLAKVTSDPIEIRDQVLSILVAGRDTTASTLSFFFMEMGKNPEIFSKLRTVIIDHFGTDRSNISFDTLKSCQYLQWCLSETLRLYPAVPSNSRRSVVDTTLPRGGGPDGLSPVFVPKGTEVNYTIYSTQRCKEYWGEDAHQYKPERWQGHKTGFEFLPFNGGPRICLGQQFALTESAYVITRLLQEFDQMNGSPSAAEPVTWSLTLTGRPKTGTRIRLHKAPSV